MGFLVKLDGIVTPVGCYHKDGSVLHEIMKSGPSIQSLLNAEKLSLPVDTAVDTQVGVSDGFYMSGAGTSEANAFYFANGTLNGKTYYTRPGFVNDGGANPFGACWWDGAQWIFTNSLADSLYKSTFGENPTNPWDTILWDNSEGSGVEPFPTLTHPAIQTLAAPGRGALLVSGGSQDGAYSERTNYSGLINGKKTFGLLGISDTDVADNFHTFVDWDDLGAGFRWNIWDPTGDHPVYYSLSDTPTPLTATGWKIANSGVAIITISGAAYTPFNGAYQLTGTHNDKPYYTSGSGRRLFWGGDLWLFSYIEGGFNSCMLRSSQDVATPDLITEWYQVDGDPTGQTDGHPDWINSNMVVSGSSISGLNGTYTKRGVLNGYSYYNLIGKPDDPFAFAISHTSNVGYPDLTWIIYHTGAGDIAHQTFFGTSSPPGPGWVNVSIQEAPVPITNIAATLDSTGDQAANITIALTDPQAGVFVGPPLLLKGTEAFKKVGTYAGKPHYINDSFGDDVFWSQSNPPVWYAGFNGYTEVWQSLSDTPTPLSAENWFPAQINISGCDDTGFNDTTGGWQNVNGFYNGRPIWDNENGTFVGNGPDQNCYWNGSRWVMGPMAFNTNPPTPGAEAYLGPTTAFPWQGAWSAGTETGTPVVALRSDPMTVTMGSGGTQDGIFTPIGTFGGKELFFLLGLSGSQIKYDDGAQGYHANAWVITDNDDTTVYYSLSDVATPDLATDWKNASDDTPASITVTSVSVGELAAGLRIGDVTYVVNGNTNGRNNYSDVLGVAPDVIWKGSKWADGVTDYNFGNVAFPWQGTPEVSVLRDDVAAEANWIPAP